MTDTNAAPEESPAKQRRTVLFALGMDALLMVFSVIAILVPSETTGNIGIGIWIVALFVFVAANAVKAPELKKLKDAGIILFMLASAVLFVALAMNGSYADLGIF